MCLCTQLITGNGNNSVDGIAKVKPVVKARLEGYGLTVMELPCKGVLVVCLDGPVQWLRDFEGRLMYPPVIATLPEELQRRPAVHGGRTAHLPQAHMARLRSAVDDLGQKMQD